jgi:hypothetical protein
MVIHTNIGYFLLHGLLLRLELFSSPDVISHPGAARFI